MNWINPEDHLPKDGQIVAVLMYHNKNHWPLSVEIFFGEVESYTENGFRVARVQTNDFTGYGSVSYALTGNEGAEAWCDAKEFEKPSFIKHNEWWGKVFPERKE